MCEDSNEPFLFVVSCMAEWIYMDNKASLIYYD